MRATVLIGLIVVVILAIGGLRVEAEENAGLEERVTQLESRIAELETGVILPGEDVRYESIGITEVKGLFLGKNRVSIACLVTPMEEALAPDLKDQWHVDNWSFFSCVRFPPTMGMQ